jgi:hypothetical protein
MIIMTSIPPINPSQSNIIDPTPVNPTSTFNSQSASTGSNNDSDPWSFGGYFNEEETKKFKASCEKTISTQIKKNQAKSHEATEQLKRSIESGDLYQ